MSKTVTAYATITPNWQVHIPVAIRKAIGLTRHGRVKVEVAKEAIILKPEKEEAGITALAGMFKKEYKKNPIDIDTIRDRIDYSDL